MTEVEEKIIKKIGEEKKGMGFAQFLAWASEQAIEFADVIVAPLVARGRVQIDYLTGKYFVA